MSPSRTDFEALDSQAALLLQSVENLGTPFGLEHSFRLCPGGLFGNRFLVSIAREAVEDIAILDLCRRLQIPVTCLQSVEQRLKSAKFLHFGFEQGDRACLYKTYFESGNDCEVGGSVVQHQAIKWDPTDSKQHVWTNYIWHRGLDVQSVLQRLEAVFGNEHGPSREIARDLVLVAASRIGAEDLHFMEVTEDDNQRSSFDIRLYNTGLLLRDLRSFLARMCEQFAIPIAHFDSFRESIDAQPVGHLAGGIHRNGQEFFNVYYGVEKRHGAAVVDDAARG